jgi:hypothetical protein
MPANDNVTTVDIGRLFPPPIDPRDLPVRFSRLKAMSASPAHYYAACQRATNEEETLAMRLGSGVHALVLDQPVVLFPGRRAGEKWDQFQAANAGAVILNQREWAEAFAMASSILRHKEAATLLLDGTTREELIEWSFLGRACSSRVDARSRYHLAELKTARTSKPGLFARDAIRMHYHGQCAFYDAANVATGGEPFANVYVIAVEKTDPFPVTVYRLTERALERGRQTNRLWFEQLLACESANEWPGYAESIVDLDTPDDEGPIEIEIDGRLTEVE